MSGVRAGRWGGRAGGQAGSLYHQHPTFVLTAPSHTQTCSSTRGSNAAAAG